MMKMKRILTGMTVFAIVLCSFLLHGDAMGVSAEHAILIDANSGRVLYEKRADERSLIASTTKIMTALVVCEQCNMNDRVEIMPEAVGIEGSSMYLQAGEVLTVQELLYGMMLHSGNDAAVALAIYCGGPVADFAELMNDEARRLGLENSHFENPNGLDSPAHYSTARDLAKLTAYAMENETFAQTVGTKSITVGDRYLTNHNKLLWRYNNAEGVKTGYTKAAGRILVSSAKQDGRRLIAVSINAPDDWNDHERLLSWGFEQYTERTIVTAGSSVGTLEVYGTGATLVPVVAEQDFVFPLAEGEKPEFFIPGTGFVYGPVEAGASAGTAYVMLNGRPIGKIPLLWGAGVAAS